MYCGFRDASFECMRRLDSAPKISPEKSGIGPAAAMTHLSAVGDRPTPTEGSVIIGFPPPSHSQHLAASTSLNTTIRCVPRWILTASTHPDSSSTSMPKIKPPQTVLVSAELWWLGVELTADCRRRRVRLHDCARAGQDQLQGARRPDHSAGPECYSPRNRCGELRLQQGRWPSVCAL